MEEQDEGNVDTAGSASRVSHKQVSGDGVLLSTLSPLVLVFDALVCSGFLRIFVERWQTPCITETTLNPCDYHCFCLALLRVFEERKRHSCIQCVTTITVSHCCYDHASHTGRCSLTPTHTVRANDEVTSGHCSVCLLVSDVCPSLLL